MASDADGDWLPLDAAVARVLADAAPLGGERVPLAHALDRTLAREVRAPGDLPPWPNSAMDGYALHEADVPPRADAPPRQLRVRGTTAAGDPVPPPLEPGVAERIMTGAPVPPGCATVVRLEDTSGGVERVEVRRWRDRGRNVRAAGEDVRAGDLAVRGGTRLDAAHLGALAAVGAAEVEVVRAPRVLVLSSGDELVEVHEHAAAAAHGASGGPARIVSTNGRVLSALAARAGALVRDGGILRDDPDAWAEALAAADGYDLVLTTGGAAVGAHDHARAALAAVGATLHFWRVRARPASQTAFARLGPTAFLALPGNPVSALVGFELFARPFVRRLSGDRTPFRRPIAVRLAEAVAPNPALPLLLRARLAPGRDGVLEARLAGPQGTGLAVRLADADALLVVPPGDASVPAGRSLAALLLGEPPRALRAARFTLDPAAPDDDGA